MERCPCCRARLGGALLCPRCRTDLSHAIQAERCARLWLSKALRYWQENKIEPSVSALELSLRLNKNDLAFVFRDYLIQQQCRAVLDLLAQKRLLSAAQHLYNARRLLPYSELLQNLRSFTDHLLAKHHRDYRLLHGEHAGLWKPG
ncbi:MAG: hypothetical protein ACU837_06295 [Gammaproteobacteria bacterium]